MKLFAIFILGLVIGVTFPKLTTTPETGDYYSDDGSYQGIVKIWRK